MIYLKSIFYFILAGLLEIGGGYLVWLWLRESKSWVYGLSGMVVWPYTVLFPRSNRPILGGYMPPMEEYLSSCRCCGDGKWTASNRMPTI